MKRLVLLAAVAAALGSGLAADQTPPAAQTPPAPTGRPATPGQLPEGITEQMRVQAHDINKLLAEGKVTEPIGPLVPGPVRLQGGYPATRALEYVRGERA